MIHYSIKYYIFVVMRWIRLLLFPFSILYGGIIYLRNLCFDKGWLTTTRYDFPVITVGNLSVGGTGKSPMIEYLIRNLYSTYKIATLSRGYKRTSKGFVLASEKSTVASIGDEPLQFYSKFKSDITVAVDAKRVEGIEKLRTLDNQPEVILLDDAFQHRQVTAGFNILLTMYNDLYVDDYMLPTGNLREPRSGAKRADCIIVTKCPNTLSESEQNAIRKKIQPKANQELFFTTIKYATSVANGNEEKALNEFTTKDVILITGIANPKPFVAYIDGLGIKHTHLSFPDHHNFSEAEIKQLQEKANGKNIITTEKDFMRLNGKLSNLYYLPIAVQFLSDEVQFLDRLNFFIKKKASL